MNEKGTQKISVTELFNTAVAFEKRGNIQEALNYYLATLQKDQLFREAYINLGSIYSRINKLSSAIKCYQKALAISEDYLGYFNLGCIHYKLNEYKKAVIKLEKSRFLNGDFFLSSLVIGLCYSKLKNTKAAEINFREVLKKDPGHRVAATALAILYYNDKQYDKAITLLNELTGDETKNLVLREMKSDILYQTGKIDESAEEIKQIMKVSDGFTFYDQYISSIPVEVYTDKYGTLDDKISILSSNNKNDSQNLITLSLCYLFKGDTDRAIDYLFQAKKTTEQ